MSDKWKLPYINQNLLTLIVGLLALGFAEYYRLVYLGIISLIFSVFLSLSVCWTMWKYTKEYNREE